MVHWTIIDRMVGLLCNYCNIFALSAYLAHCFKPAGGQTPILAPVTDPGDRRVYDYKLRDVNPASPTAGEIVGPSAFTGQVTMHYFGHQS